MTGNAALAAADVIALIDGALADADTSPDAMRWHPADQDAAVPAALEVPADLRVGDVVDYHGSITSHHGECVVVAVDAHTGRLTLRDHQYPEKRLTRVRTSSVTPTGRWVPVCRCGHPHTHPINAATGACPRSGCRCPHHP